MGQCFQLLRLKQTRHGGGLFNHPLSLENSYAHAEQVACFNLAGILATCLHFSIDGNPI
jgi:hypothetical protein